MFMLFKQLKLQKWIGCQWTKKNKEIRVLNLQIKNANKPTQITEQRAGEK